MLLATVASSGEVLRLLTQQADVLKAKSLLLIRAGVRDGVRPLVVDLEPDVVAGDHVADDPRHQDRRCPTVATTWTPMLESMM